LFVGENILCEGHSLVGGNTLSLVIDSILLPGNSLVGDNTCGVDSSFFGENILEGGTSLVGKNFPVGETLLVGDNSLGGEKILEGESDLDGDMEVGDITLVRGGILEVSVETSDLPVKPTALLSIPENVLPVLPALSRIPPVVDARFIGRSRGFS
jgi:hypothetical protein